MCAIMGWLCMPGAEPPLHALTAMSDALRHRGPDDSGKYTDRWRGVALAHRRLSIIDLSDASHQPMVDDASGVVLAYNGELYNFRDLRSELEGLGHSFRSMGDTEVVLRSFLQWGTGSFARMAGMFALALWDPRDGTLHLARDAMGMKPLYYHAGSHGVVFASELKALRAVAGPAVDRRALEQYLEFGYVFDEHRTMLEGVNKLPPGSRIEVREGRIVRQESWFTPPTPDRGDSRGEAERIEELGSVMRQVVREHLVADVPLALLLSGGIDSGLLAALGSREQQLTTITMGFDRSGIDERDNARLVSQHVGSRHIDVLIAPDDVKAEVEAGAWVFDDLFADWGTLTTRLLYRRCREMGIKVVLVGEGADELFGGYEVFKAPAQGLWQQFRLYQRYAGRRHGRLFGEFRRVFGQYMEAGGGDAFNAIRLFESRRQLPNQYVMKVDKASMAESVEARAPYLDRRIAELAYRTPAAWLQRGGENKYLLRALSRTDGLLPPQASARPKFGAPLAASWMDDDKQFRAFARELLLDSASFTSRLGLGRAMRAYYDQGKSGDAFPRPLSIFRNLAWRLLLLELWAQHYIQPRAA